MRPVTAIAAIVFVAVTGAIPLFDNAFLITHFTRILIYAIFAMSLDLLVGYCGMVSLGHAAFFGIAAYTDRDAFGEGGYRQCADRPAAQPVRAAAAGALIIGVLTLRTGGIYFIMATLAFAQMLFFLVNDNDFFGGSDGSCCSTRFRASIGNVVLLDLSDAHDPLLRGLGRGVRDLHWARTDWCDRRSGVFSQGIKSNEQRMRALGYPVERYKLAASSLAARSPASPVISMLPLTSLADPSILTGCIRRGADDGHHRRHGHADRAGRRRVRAHRVGRSELRTYRALEADSRCGGDCGHAVCARWACRPGWRLCVRAGWRRRQRER